MTDWIHCNKCFLGFKPQFKFYLTTCGHIKCQKCAATLGPEKECLLCRSVCDLAQLSNNLKPDILSFFRPYNESNLKWKQIYTFQFENTISYIKKTTAKYNLAKGEIRKHYKIIQDLKKQNDKLKMMVSSATRGGFVASTPTPGVSATPMHGLPSITPIRIPSKITLQQIDDSLSKFMPRNHSRYSAEITPRNQPRYSAEMTGHQQRTQMKNSTTSKSVPFFGELQGTTLFTPARFNRDVTTPENPAMISMSHLRFGSSNSSH